MRGITLTEVLISMGILTLGLLGVAALFPVGGHYMQQADVSDNGAMIGRAVMNDLQAKGILNPKAWYAFVPPPPTGATTAHATFTYDGYFAPIKAIESRYSFTRPLSLCLNEALSQPTSTPATISKQFGNAFVIDPLYIAAAAEPVADLHNVVAYCFPANASQVFPRNGGNYYKADEWRPWRSTGTTSKPERVWPIRRITLQDISGFPTGKLMADYLCRVTDDLATDLPGRDDLPAHQLWETADVNNDGVLDPLTRDWNGDYSWIASVAPATNASRNALARSPEGYSYDVSVVVFRKRVLPPDTAANLQGDNVFGETEAARNERMMTAAVVSTGMNGGELLLQAVDTLQPAEAFDHLRGGQFIMLCGPHPASADAEPRFSMDWYQVLSIEAGNAANQRLVSVRGPQWPWNPATNPNALSNQLCVGVFRGAVAVHSRTMRLDDSSEGSSGLAIKAVVPGQPLVNGGN